MSILLKGMAIGFSIAAPVGPMGVMCIQRSLSRGALGGLSVGLGVALADAFYGAVAGFGLTMISDFLLRWQDIFALVGGAVLLWMGWKILRNAQNTTNAPVADVCVDPGSGARKTAGDLGTCFFLGLTNPATIIYFIAVFSALGAEGLGGKDGMGHQSALTLVGGVFAGSMLWWSLLTATTGMLRERIKARLTLVSKISGLVIAGFGVGAWAMLLV